MNALINTPVCIADKQTSIIEYQSVPVMTTEQLADFYGTETDNVKKNFSNNTSRFIEGKHYFKVEGAELKAFKNMVTGIHHVPKHTARLMLWTEKGAARHAKILDTDQSWNVFEQLEDCYFNFKKQSQQNDLTLPNFADPAEAAIAWAAEYKAKQIAQQERDHAVATKAEIGKRREATAMATASAKSREAEKLKEQLGESKNYASIKAVETVTGEKFNWRTLKKWCQDNGKKIKDIYDANYGSVKTYPKDAWQAVYGIKLNSIFRA
ncbi:ORF6N domain-containing protein [Acinetobacter larvae]|uniref:KilA-N DNA-binding domain-containing protein n=1 Tax=Acinetobacter larvae TaxID=1789224 RepID=A0A1B2LZ83_9GAMM|nr:ORF6N domain-containing protein [Acinetobacter larvae]AOA58231.1 hypothetical protein BFG52_07610 [Acinetobacter larvae]